MERPEEQNKGIVLKEYGRNIQKIVNHVLTIEDREKRSRYARTLIELMKLINPSMRDAQDSYGKLWDHLYIMSNFELDVDTSYPMPEKAVLGRKPMRVEYNTHSLYFKHYGRNIELLIAQAIEKTDPEEREAGIIYLGKLMKRFYAAWNKENISDEVIVEHLTKMSKGKLTIDVERVKAGNLFDSVQKEFKDYREGREPKDGNREGGHREGREFKDYKSGNGQQRKKPFNKDKRKRS